MIGRSNVDDIITHKIVLENSSQRNREIHIALIDLERAYDTVPIQSCGKKRIIWKSI